MLEVRHTVKERKNALIGLVMWDTADERIAEFDRISVEICKIKSKQ